MRSEGQRGRMTQYDTVGPQRKIHGQYMHFLGSDKR